MENQAVAFLVKRFFEFHWGHFLFNKVTFIISVSNFLILISLKWEVNVINYLYYILPCLLIIIWFIGFLFEITGARKQFQDSQFKGVKLSGEN